MGNIGSGAPTKRIDYQRSNKRFHSSNRSPWYSNTSSVSPTFTTSGDPSSWALPLLSSPEFGITGIMCIPKFLWPWARSRKVESVARGSGPRSRVSLSIVVMEHRPQRCHTSNSARPIRTRFQVSSSQGWVPCTTMLGRNRCMSTGAFPLTPSRALRSWRLEVVARRNGASSARETGGCRVLFFVPLLVILPFSVFRSKGTASP
mmetsp:Transcript_59/g.143  ORF Transcript_59/g.143 Transcript_59/m.143 type:complete len:204 (-) Transcript_59:903-1514(-)